MVPLSFDSQRTSNNSDCPFISKQRQQTVQIFARDREYLGSCSCSGSSTLKLPHKQTCFQNTELTLEMFRKISTSSCHQIPNELSNLLAPVATCSTQTVNQNTNVPAEVCKVPIKRKCGLTVTTGRNRSIF